MGARRGCSGWGVMPTLGDGESRQPKLGGLHLGMIHANDNLAVSQQMMARKSLEDC